MTTLKLKQPLSVMQQERLSQIFNPLSSKEKPKRERADNINNENKKSGTDELKGKREKNFADERARAYLKKKSLLEAIDWLCVTYPNCFNKESPKPLNVGIFNDILGEGHWPHSKTFLRKTLCFYTRSLDYQKAIIQLGLRYFLNGEVSQGITEFEKENAKKNSKS